MNQVNSQVVIMGGGPAGLTAAYQLMKEQKPAIVLEKGEIVGGLSRTGNYKGYFFDIGGHRFFTKVKAVEDIWREVLSNGEFLRRKRISRIYFNGKFYSYPLRLSPELFQIGLWNMARIGASFTKSHIFPSPVEDNLEQWVTNRFGKRLYEIFFKTYTEKVWGMLCSEISSDWAAQRIKDLSLWVAIKSVFKRNPSVSKEGVIKTLIEEFDYPALGPGMMWERMSELIQAGGGHVQLDTKVKKIFRNENQITAVEVEKNGRIEVIDGLHFISTLPIRHLIQMLTPTPPLEIMEAAENLRYRDFLTVVLIINKRDMFPDNWIYIHDPEVRVGRVQNFKNWSPAMVPNPEKTCLGLEYFCFKDDDLWQMPDEKLIELGKRELSQINLIKAEEVIDGKVIRVPKAYPIYDNKFKDSLDIICQYLSGFDNLQLVGRNGMHKYNNQDHSMLTAMLAVKNILGASHDLWSVNVEGNYHEEIKNDELRSVLKDLGETQPRVPKKILAKSAQNK